MWVARGQFPLALTALPALEDLWVEHNAIPRLPLWVTRMTTLVVRSMMDDGAARAGWGGMIVARAIHHFGLS